MLSVTFTPTDTADYNSVTATVKINVAKQRDDHQRRGLRFIPSSWPKCNVYGSVAASAPGSVIPTGSVQFQVDGVNFGSPVPLVNGSATSPATSAVVGGHALHHRTVQQRRRQLRRQQWITLWRPDCRIGRANRLHNFRRPEHAQLGRRIDRDSVQREGYGFRSGGPEADAQRRRGGPDGSNAHVVRWRDTGRWATSPARRARRVPMF